MEIEFVAAVSPLGAAVAPKTALARIVCEGEALDGPLGQAAAASRFTGAKGQALDILAPQGTDAARLVLVGAGKREAFDALAAEHAAASAYAAVKASGLELLRVEPPNADAELAARAALGVRLASYRFDKYRTKEPAEKKPSRPRWPRRTRTERWRPSRRWRRWRTRWPSAATWSRSRPTSSIRWSSLSG